MSGDALGAAERLVLALIWLVAVVAGLIEVLLGLIWVGGGLGDAPGPTEPSRTVATQIAGGALLILGCFFLIALSWRFRAVWSFRLERRGGRVTARLLLILTVLLIGLGAAADVARGDGKLFLTTTLGVLDASAFIAAVLIFIEPKLTM